MMALKITEKGYYYNTNNNDYYLVWSHRAATNTTALNSSWKNTTPRKGKTEGDFMLLKKSNKDVNKVKRF